MTEKRTLASYRHSTRERFVFIEDIIEQRGYINRRDIRERFGVSEPQAANDFRAYLKLAPHNIWFDRSAKCYKRHDLFRRITQPNSAPDVLGAWQEAFAVWQDRMGYGAAGDDKERARRVAEFAHMMNNAKGKLLLQQGENNPTM